MTPTTPPHLRPAAAITAVDPEEPCPRSATTASPTNPTNQHEVVVVSHSNKMDIPKYGRAPALYHQGWSDTLPAFEDQEVLCLCPMHTHAAANVLAHCAFARFTPTGDVLVITEQGRAFAQVTAHCRGFHHERCPAVEMAPPILTLRGFKVTPPLALVHRKCATVHARESPLGLRLPIHAPSSGLRGVRRQRRCVTHVTTKWLLWTNLPGLMARVGDDARPPHALKVHNGLLKTDTDSKHPRMNRLIISSPQTPEALRPQTYAPTDPCPVTLVWALSRCSIHCSDQGHHQTSNTTVLGNPRIFATPSGDLRGRDG